MAVNVFSHLVRELIALLKLDISMLHADRSPSWKQTLGIIILLPDSFHMATFFTFPSIFYPVAVGLGQKISLGMTGTSVASGRKWQQATSPSRGSKKPTGLLQTLCIHALRKAYETWKL